MPDRLELTSAVRRVLVKNWIDMSKVRIQIAGATAIIRGTLEKIHSGDPITGLLIEDLEQKIRGVKGIGQVRWQLEDWTAKGGTWRKK